MHHPVANLLRSALIPELRADVTAGSPRDVHGGLVSVATVRTLPDELACVVARDANLTIVPAFLTVVTLGIELGVHDMFINVLDNGENRWNVLRQVRHFDVAYRAARGELLELRLER